MMMMVLVLLLQLLLSVSWQSAHWWNDTVIRCIIENSIEADKRRLTNFHQRLENRIARQITFREKMDSDRRMKTHTKQNKKQRR